MAEGTGGENIRPIDADDLISFLIKAGRFVKGQDDKRTAAHAIGKIIEHVEKMPTIDAIPVEWLKKRRFETSYNGYEPDVDLNHAFCTVMNEWQEEQEARLWQSFKK